MTTEAAERRKDPIGCGGQRTARQLDRERASLQQPRGLRKGYYSVLVVELADVDLLLDLRRAFDKRPGLSPTPSYRQPPTQTVVQSTTSSRQSSSAAVQ